MLAALAGGVGAARFLAGLVRCVEPRDITVVVNTGDDEEFFGLHVAPDLDSITYTLAGASNAEQGWGLAGESFRTMEALARYGEPTWFGLGDLDLATHIFRTRRLHEGSTLSEVTRDIVASWGLELQLLPMSDDRVRTRITCARPDGTHEELAMQEWFVRERAAPPVVAVGFDGAEQARPADGVLEALDAADTIVICPSNPVISIGPILAVPGVRDLLVRRRDRVVAVCPIIDGAPVRGPADRLMAPLGIEVSPVGVARHYREFCATLVIDERDAAHADAVRATGVRAVVTETLMRSPQIAAELAQCTLAAVA
jgi:LPPG:FO 2-phospho-L-lactate transferase